MHIQTQTRGKCPWSSPLKRFVSILHVASTRIFYTTVCVTFYPSSRNTTHYTCSYPASSPSGAADVTLLSSTRIHPLSGMKISSIAYHHTTHNHIDSTPHPHLSLMLLYFLCTRVHTHPFLPTSNTLSPTALPSRASLLAAVYTPNPTLAVSLLHQNGHLLGFNSH